MGQRLNASTQIRATTRSDPQIEELQFDQIATPIGAVIIVANSGALYALDFADCIGRLDELLAARLGSVSLNRARDPDGFSSRVEAYFDGELDALQDAPVEMGGTPFQRSVWAALRKAVRAPLVAVAAVFFAAHALLHIHDVARGLLESDHLLLDVPGVYLPALFLVWAAIHFSREPLGAR